MLHRIRYGHWPRWMYWPGLVGVSRHCKVCGRGREMHG